MADSPLPVNGVASLRTALVRHCPPVISRNRAEAMAALAIDMGQDMKWLDFAEVEELELTAA